MAFISNATRVSPVLRLLHINGTRVCLRPTALAASVPTTTTIGSIYQGNRLGLPSVQVSSIHQFPNTEEVGEKLTGAIIPWSQQTFIQKLFAPYTYTLMYTLDFLVAYMPWWTAIVATTAAVKIIFLPLMVKQQKITVGLHNLLPQTQKLQAKMNEAMVAGDKYTSAMMQAKLKIIYKENNLNMFDRLKPQLIQAPMFMSFFFLLRNLTEHQEAMKTGGALWFPDLTVADPLFLLPLMACTSMWLLLESGLGAEGAQGGSGLTPAGKWFVRVMPVGLFAIVYSFPAATLLFWSTNNFITLVTALLFKNQTLARKLNIPDRIKHDPSSLPLARQTLSEQIQRAKELGTKSKSTMDLRRLDDLAFKKAGIGPLRKTYKSPPTPSDDR